MNVVQSIDPFVDTLKCPKCKAIWRAKVVMNPGDDRYDFEYGDDHCPNGCRNLFGFRLEGKVIKKET